MNKNKTNFLVIPNIFIIIGILILAVFAVNNAIAESKSGQNINGSIANPGVNLWREVRQRNGVNLGITQIRNKDSGTLINSKGEHWRQLRVNQIIPYSGMALLITLLILILFRLIRGKVKIESGRSDNKLMRFTISQRTIHWVMASFFVLLGLTGIIILLGRTLLKPYLGGEVFGSLAFLSKILHDYSGPIFAVVLIMMFFSFVKGNFYKLKDIQWFIKGGGMFGTHASAGRYNAGEKSWFWLVMIGGLTIVASGLVLDFPFFNLDREGLSLALIIHGIAAIVVLVASFGHIFMGTVAMEGALETMTTGYCDENWAKEHHDEWFDEMKNKS